MSFEGFQLGSYGKVMKLNKIILTTAFVSLGACRDDGKKSQPDNRKNAEQAAPCSIVLERKCIVPGDNKCLAYETVELSNCKEGN